MRSRVLSSRSWRSKCIAQDRDSRFTIHCYILIYEVISISLS